MSLTTGARLGSCDILGPIGAGGMGEVYRARDTKLDRDVAIKILREIFAADPDRLIRLARAYNTSACGPAGALLREREPARAGSARAPPFRV